MGIESALLAVLIAHQGQFARTLMLEPAGGVVHVVVHLSVSGEERKRALSILDRKRLESLLAQRALDGVRLMSGTSSVSVDAVQIKTALEGGMALMIHGTARVSGPDLAVVTAANADPIDLVVLPGDRPVVRATRGARAGGLKAKMGPSDRIR